MLGCGEWSAVVTGRCGASGHGVPVDVPIVSLTVGREMQATSTASVVFGACRDCDESGLGAIRAGGHELLLLRDGVPVWVGPVTAASWSDPGEVRASDLSAWLAVRVVHSALSWSGVDVAQAAADVVDDALAPDDPCVALDVADEGVSWSGGWGANTVYAGTALEELSKAGLEWTVVGRRLILGGLDRWRLPMLTDGDFVERPLVAESGLGAMATRVVVANAERTVVGSAGGVDPFYGLVERLVELPNVSLGGASGVAAGRLAGLSSARLTMGASGGDGSFSAVLSPDAPVSWEMLVPGAVVPVALSEWCRDIATGMRLWAVQVTWDASGEQVALTLGQGSRISRSDDLAS